jgi:hypothetical protein
MVDLRNVETMEAQIQEIKAEQTRCQTKTLRNLNTLYEILHTQENSEEEAAAVPEPTAQV